MDNSLQIVNTNHEMQEWSDKIRACSSKNYRSIFFYSQEF